MEREIIVHKSELPKIFDDIKYAFFKHKLLELNKSTYKSYCFCIKLISKNDYFNGIEAIYEVLAFPGQDWELDVFYMHFILKEIDVNSEYKIIPLKEEEGINYLKGRKLRIIVKIKSRKI